MKQPAASLPAPGLAQGRVVFLWKLVEYAGLVGFILVVPRLMGPAPYGSLALLLSLVGLFTIAFGLGAAPVFARFVPEYEQRRERSRTQALFMELLLVRLVLATLIGGAFAAIFPLLLPHEVSPVTLAAGATALVLGAVSVTCYQIFFGLNNLGRWLTYQALTKPVLLIFLVVLGGTRSLQMLWLYWRRKLCSSFRGFSGRVPTSRSGRIPVAPSALRTIILRPHAGSYGAAGAVALALAVAGLITFYQFPLNPVLAAANYRRLILLGLVAMGVLALPSLSVIPMGLIAIMGFFAFLFVGKVISIGELRQIYQARLAH